MVHGGAAVRSSDSAAVDVTAARSTIDSAGPIVPASRLRETAPRTGPSSAAASPGAATGRIRDDAADVNPSASRTGFWAWITGCCGPPQHRNDQHSQHRQLRQRNRPSASGAAVSAEPVPLTDAIALPVIYHPTATATDASVTTATDLGPGKAIGAVDVSVPHRSPGRRPITTTSSQIGSSIRLVDDCAANSAKSRKSPGSSVGLRTLPPAVSPEHRHPPIRVVGTGGTSATTSATVTARFRERDGSESGRQDTSGSLGSAVVTGVGQTTRSLADATTSAGCRDGSAGLAPA